MKNSSLMVFSVLYNVRQIINKKLETLDNVLDKRPFIHFKNAKKMFQDNSKRIYNDLENHYYEYKDLIIFMLYKYGMGEDIGANLYSITTKEVNYVKSLFTMKQLDKDKEFILQLKKHIELKSAVELFTIRHDGSPIIFELIKKRFISPVIYIRLYDQVLTSENKDVILKSTDYECFDHAMKLIIKTIKNQKTLRRSFLNE